MTQAENDELRDLLEMQRKKVFPADARLVRGARDRPFDDRLVLVGHHRRGQ